MEGGPAGAARLARLLDALRAAEVAGAAALGRWLEHCADPALRGGLRVVRARDQAHASLVAERLAALGGAAGVGPDGRLVSLCALLGGSGHSDRAKLGVLVARLPAEGQDPAGPLGPLARAAGDDRETRGILDTIADDDRVSMSWLRAVAAAPGSAGRGPAPTALALRRLDALRAAEQASARVFAAWAAATARPALRGGLRGIAAREAVHAALLAARLAELGGEPVAAVPAVLAAAVLARFGATGEDDDGKLEAVLRRTPEPQAAAWPASALAGTMEDDAESRTLLELIAAGERATFTWLRAQAGQQAPATGPPAPPAAPALVVVVGEPGGPLARTGS